MLIPMGCVIFIKTDVHGRTGPLKICSTYGLGVLVGCVLVANFYGSPCKHECLSSYSMEKPNWTGNVDFSYIRC